MPKLPEIEILDQGVEEFIGTRLWTIKPMYNDGNGYLGPVLVSPQQDFIWPTGEIKAKCMTHDHPAPQVDCGCGFYAIKKTDKPSYAGWGVESTSKDQISGEIKMYGIVIEGSKSAFISEFCEVSKLYVDRLTSASGKKCLGTVDPSKDPEVIAKMAAYYKAEVIENKTICNCLKCAEFVEERRRKAQLKADRSKHDKIINEAVDKQTKWYQQYASEWYSNIAVDKDDLNYIMTRIREKEATNTIDTNLSGGTIKTDLAMFALDGNGDKILAGFDINGNPQYKMK